MFGTEMGYVAIHEYHQKQLRFDKQRDLHRILGEFFDSSRRIR